MKKLKDVLWSENFFDTFKRTFNRCFHHSNGFRRIAICRGISDIKLLENKSTNSILELPCSENCLGVFIDNTHFNKIENSTCEYCSLYIRQYGFNDPAKKRNQKKSK